MGILKTSQLPSCQQIRSAIAAENEQAQDFQKQIQVARQFCRTHGTAAVVVQVALPVRPLPLAKGNPNSTASGTAIQALWGKSAKAVEGGFKLRSKRQTPCNLPGRG